MTGELDHFLPDAILGLYVGEALAEFGGDDIFPAFILLNDGAGGHGFFRWLEPDAELETLSTSVVDWSATLTLTVISRDGAGSSVLVEERPLQ